MSLAGAAQAVLLLAAFGVIIEAFVTWRLGRPAYAVRETETSLGLATGWLVTGGLGAMLGAWAVGVAYEHRIADLGAGLMGWVFALLAADLVYYLWHRASHASRYLWASHSVHHTAGQMNVLTAFRQGWTDILAGVWLAWAPLGLVGVRPEQVAAYLLLLLIWEALIHNQWIGRLGPAEQVLVTPARHRVHHSLAPEHHDRNFGGILIVWDLVFRTAADEGPGRVTEFGVAGYDPAKEGPVATSFREWRSLFADWRARLVRG